MSAESDLKEQKGVRPLVFSGPSGSGKSTLIQKLFEKHPNRFQFSVSHTTRQPRPGEQDGRHYWFVSQEKVQDMVLKGEFLEFTRFAGNCYGTSRSAVEAVVSSGRIPVLDVDVRGVRSLKVAGLSPPPVYIYVQAPSMAVLRQRLIKRNADSEQKIEQRLAEAAEGDAYAAEPGAYDIVIINDNLDVAFKELDEFLVDKIPTDGPATCAGSE